MLGHEYNFLEIKSTAVRSIPIMTPNYDYWIHNNGHAKKYCTKDMQKNHYIMKYIKLIAG